jgi:glycerophosphoryl diester phosphodiesterase
VEIDVNLSKDGVHYVLHGPLLERTTNGSGNICDWMAAEIDVLDAGSWFHERFATERVPRLEPFLRWIKGKAKVFLDVKAANLSELIALIYALDLQHECFFWFGKDEEARRFRQLNQELPLKINVCTPADVVRADEEFGANLVEVKLEHMSQALMNECRRRGLRIMIYHPHKDTEGFRQVLRWGVDLVNVDHADYFQQVMEEYLATEQVAPEPNHRA